MQNSSVATCQMAGQIELARQKIFGLPYKRVNSKAKHFLINKTISNGTSNFFCILCPDSVNSLFKSSAKVYLAGPQKHLSIRIFGLPTFPIISKYWGFKIQHTDNGLLSLLGGCSSQGN